MSEMKAETKAILSMLIKEIYDIYDIGGDSDKRLEEIMYLLRLWVSANDLRPDAVIAIENEGDIIVYTKEGLGCNIKKS